MHQRHEIIGLKRLRVGKKIVGYERQENQAPFYSKDLFWWNGERLPHSEIDRAIGLRDKNNRYVFINDIIEVDTGKRFRGKKMYRIAEYQGKVGLIALKGDKHKELEHLLEIRSFEVLSFTFLHDDIPDSSL